MESHDHGSPHRGMQHKGPGPYTMFAVNMLLSLIVMYLVMFSMVDGWPDSATT